MKNVFDDAMNVYSLRIAKYGSRHFAVYDGDTLVCVTVYRKGAAEVIRRLIGHVRKQDEKRACIFLDMCDDVKGNKP